MAKNKFYVVIFGEKAKILDSLEEFQKEVKNKPNAQRGFTTREAAELYIKNYPNTPVSTYYVVHTGKKPGIYLSSAEYKEETDGFKNFVAKKVSTLEEAQSFLTATDKQSGANLTEKILSDFYQKHPSLAPKAPVSTKEDTKTDSTNYFYAVYKGVRPGLYKTKEMLDKQIIGIDNAVWAEGTLQECQSFLCKNDKKNDTKLNSLIQKTDTLSLTGNPVVRMYYVVQSKDENTFYDDEAILRRALLQKGSRFIAFKDKQKAIDYCKPVSDDESLKGLRKIGTAASAVSAMIPPPGIYRVSSEHFKLDKGPDYWKKCSQRNPNTVFAFTDGSGSHSSKGSSACVSFFNTNMYAEKMTHSSSEVRDTAYISEARAATLAISKTYSLGAKSLILFIDRMDVINNITSPTEPNSLEGKLVWKYVNKYKNKMAIFVAKVPAHKDCAINNMVDGIARAIIA